MARPPRSSNEPLLSGFVLWRTLFVGALLLVGAGLLFTQAADDPSRSLPQARTLAVNAFVTGQISYLLNVRRFMRPSWTAESLRGNRVLPVTIAACVGLQLLLTHAPFMNTLFGTAPLEPGGWLLCILAGAATFLLVEIEKVVIGRSGRGPAAP